eukprot:jgi/Undpi1/6786/HiC_scaffold_21.g09263.m1
MSVQVQPTAMMPGIQGEAVELSSRASLTPANSGRPVSSRGSVPDNNEALLSTILTRRPSTSTSDNRALVVSPGQERVPTGVQEISESKGNGDIRGGGDGGGGGRPPPGPPRCVDRRESSSSAEETPDVNAVKSKLMGGYLRNRLLGNGNSKHAAKELVKRSFRHLHRGQGHVLTLDEFKEGLSNTFGALIPLQLILATFDIFDTEPRTWQLDFDEFCHWLETGERSLNKFGISEAVKPVAASGMELPKARKPRSNDSSGGLRASAKNAQGMSMEQADRAMLKTHLMKHRDKLHNKPSGLTDAQKSVVDHILLDKIKARRKIGSMLPDLRGELDTKELFSRMDHNGDGVVDLTDFLMWEERMQDGRGNTDYWALQEEEHLEQIKIARSKASNLLVPDDYDGSTHHAKLSRDKAKKKLADDADDATRDPGDHPARARSASREEKAQGVKDNILSQVKGGSLEMLRAFRHFRPAAVGRRLFMDYREFRESIKQQGLGLSEEQIKSLFGHFDVDGSGEIDFSEFRRFLQSDINQTGLALAVNRCEEKAAAARSRQTSLSRTKFGPSMRLLRRNVLPACVVARVLGGSYSMMRRHFWAVIRNKGNNLRVLNLSEISEKQRQTGQKTRMMMMMMRFQRRWVKESHLRAKVMESFKSDHRNLLRAFRRVTRKKGSDITAADFREAVESFGLGGDKANADRLFKAYDWRQNGSVQFQELMETITNNETLPRRLTTGQRKQRLDVVKKLSDEAIKQVETKLRKGLWKKHLDDAEACFRSLTAEDGGVIGLPALKIASRNAGVSGDDACDEVLMRVLNKHSSDAGGENWTANDFVSFYRPAECRAAIALARERSCTVQSNIDAKRAALVGEGNKARAKLLTQVRRLSDVLKFADKDRTGKATRRAFAKALEKEGGLGRVGEAELTRLLQRHRCAEQGGSYVNYPAFVASFTAAVRGAESSSAVAAVAAAAAASAAAAAAPAKLPRKNLQTGEPSRSSPNLHLTLAPPRPSTASAAKCGAQGDIANAKTASDTTIPTGFCGPVGAGGDRARTADASINSRERRRRARSVERKVELSAGQGYSKRFAAGGGDIDRGSFMQGSRSAPVLPNLVGQRAEVPKTTPIHRAMKKDVTKSAKALLKGFKQCENPYRRGVISAKHFQTVCLANGVNVDREDVEFLLRQHRHKPSMGGKYAIAPAWVKGPAVTAAGTGDPAASAMMGVRYDDFLRTCLAANDVAVSAH